MINMKVRFKNPVFWTQIGLAFFLPILAYYGLTAQDLTTWGSVFDLLGDAFSNPYVIGTVVVGVWNAINDPSTKGFSDSRRVQEYDKPRDDSKYL